MRSLHNQPTILKRFLLLVSIFACIVQFIAGGSAFALSIVINDCNGSTRAVKQTEPGEASKVEVEVSSTSGTPATGAVVTLTNVISNEVMTASVENGVVSFDGLSPGVYSLVVSQEGLVVGSIWIGSATAGAALATGAGIGTIILAGGAAAGVAAGVDSLTNGGGGESPPPIVPTARPTPLPTSRPPPRPTPCPVCNPDAEPTPINSFFDSQQKQPVTLQAQVLSPYR